MNENINFVPKQLNQPNVPQARSIENFWCCLAQKVSEGGYEAKTDDQLISRVKSNVKEFDSNYAESLMKEVKAKVKSIGQNPNFIIQKI